MKIASLVASLVKCTMASYAERVWAVSGWMDRLMQDITYTRDYNLQVRN